LFLESEAGMIAVIQGKLWVNIDNITFVFHRDSVGVTDAEKLEIPDKCHWAINFNDSRTLYLPNETGLHLLDLMRRELYVKPV
jgi:hypothetical protein